jgi:arginase
LVVLRCRVDWGRSDRVLLRTPDELSANPEERAREAVGHVAARTSGWWLHVDLDVLAEEEFAARGAPGEDSMCGGLTWVQLTELISGALQVGGCRGWSVVIYNPEKDQDGREARRIVRFVADVAWRLR